MGVGNPDRRMVAQVQSGYRLVAIKRVSEHAADDHLSVVLAKNVERTEWVTWMHNRNTNGCAHGHYFLHQIMLDGDNLRETERRAWQDFVDRGHQPDLQLQLRDVSEPEPIVDDSFSRDSQPRQRVRRIGEVPIPHDVSIHAQDRNMEAAQREEPSEYTFTQLRSMGRTELFGVFAMGYLDGFECPDPQNYASVYQAFERLDELGRVRATEAFKMIAPTRG